MALSTDAVMVLSCDVASDTEDHDDWHTYEHMHERLSIPGFVRGSRWIRAGSGPRCLILYEVADLSLARAPDYLARLDNPTPWTAATMRRLRGMSRGFCRVAASAGFGLGRAGFALRFAPAPDAREWLAGEIALLASWRGLAGATLFEAGDQAPMTREQAIRGRDADPGWMLFATAYDRGALEQACMARLDAEALAARGLTVSDRGYYDLAFTATALEVARTPSRRPLEARERGAEGSREP